nr:Kv channel-interacting protein 4 isoform X1 [Crassostrea gigas]XP_034302863.1 Kv channel-interacting protein 4 isoform X2 [Crassostrea gigas]
MNKFVIFAFLVGGVMCQNDGSTLLHNLFNQMDIDLNGFLSMTEAEAVLKAMDANGDGMVTEKEFYFGLVAAAPTLWQCGKNFFDALDVDHVNLIKENHMKTIYSDMDKNANGIVSEDEFTNFIIQLENNCRVNGKISQSQRAARNLRR